MRIVAVSDVTVGYGSPQLPLLAASLKDYYDGEVKIVEPVQPELAPRHGLYPGFEILRVATADHPHTPIGRMEYIWRAAKLVNAWKPDVLVICCTYTLPVLFRLKRRPSKVIYYSIESIPFYGEFDIEMNRRAAPLLDLVLFPEENRAVLEVGRCGFPDVPKLVLYNTSNLRKDQRPALPPEQRNRRILYSGTISRDQTFADYYVSEKVRALPIDLFGPVKGGDEDKRKITEPTSGATRYRGYIGSAELAAVRPLYAYSIVAWNPNVENQFYAAPNKFFESIADGVPPVAAPHPQCKLLIERYGCGLLMADWSFETFLASLRRAMDAYGSPTWRQMVDGCARAVNAELTWDAQFDKVRMYLP
ncbi:MAG TPA: hypothetical protein VM120_23075 [Bryobacteraceae bacterium]|nr:hypothetical protein [Bryobacteraceae bacterium]